MVSEPRNGLISKRISKLLAESIVESMNFGGLFLYFMEVSGIGKNEVASKPEKFEEWLRKVYGQGATVIERRVITMLRRKLGLKEDSSLRGLSFSRFIRETLREHLNFKE